MTQSRPLLAVLVIGVLAAVGVVVFAYMAGGEPGPDDVAIRVGGVEVTFGELEVRRAAGAASTSVIQRVMSGEDLGVPEEQLRQIRLVEDLFGPLRNLDEDLAFVAYASSQAAAYAAALEDGVALGEGEIAEAMQVQQDIRDDIGTSTDPRAGFSRALFEAEQAELTPEQYEQWLYLGARDTETLRRLSDHRDLTSAEAGVLPMIAAMELAQEAEIELHPSLGVTVEEVRDYLDEQVRFQRALIDLQEQLDPDEAAGTSASD